MSNQKRHFGRAALLAAIASAFVVAWGGSAEAAPLAYTGNYDGNSVSVIDTATKQVVGKPIEVGAQPFSLAVTPDGRYVYVANYGSDDVSVIDTASRQTIGTPIPVGPAPGVIAIAPDGKTAYVTDLAAEEVSVIDLQTKVAHSIPLKGEPYGVAFTPDGKLAYVTLEEEDAIELIDTQTEKSVGQIPVGEGPINIVFTPNGATAYVTNEVSGAVSVIDTATRQTVKTIPTGALQSGIAITPNGAKAFVPNFNEDTVTVIDTLTNQAVDTIPVGEEPYEVGITPDGKTAYVAEYKSEDIVAIDTATDQKIGTPLNLENEGPWQVVVAPDQSPQAAFTPPSATALVPAAFSGADSTDPDGIVTSWNWAFGDGGTGTGASLSHTYNAAGTYNANLSVFDNEGCGSIQVFTGRTAYCSGGAATVTHPVAVAAPAIKVPSNKFTFGRMVKNRKNGTVRLQVKLPGAGSVVLTGGQVHKVTRKVSKAGAMWLTIHARVELNKRLKKIHRAKVKVRIAFTPTGGKPLAKTRSITLLRAPRKQHH
jgi:YVTN family beta-propeller protein